MRIPLNPEGDLPLYRQIEAFLREAIHSGNLPPDTRLPASRQLATDLGISRITVENAYAELKADGLITTKTGDGTYVLPPCPLGSQTSAILSTTWPLWQQDLLANINITERITPEDLLKTSRRPLPISFAGGTGDPCLFPVDDFRRTLQSVLNRDGLAALEYGEPNGFSLFRNTITHVLASQGLQTQPEQVLITSGSQQGLMLVAQLLLRPGDLVLVESPTYGGALDLFQALGLKVMGIPVDSQGMQVENLEELLQQFHPKLIYTIPNFQNPTGACLDSRRRRQLVALADRYNVPILEDDFVGDLRYDGRAQPALKALDPGGRVIYTSTFSKMLLPGVRVGFLIADGPVYPELVNRKRLFDLATSNLLQRALEAYVTVGRYQTHLHRSVQLYRKRRDAMMQAIQRYLPTDVQYVPPQGGLFLWLTLPTAMSATQLLPLAIEEGVAFAPGNTFFPNGMGGDSCLRLNFSALPPADIEEGIKRLGTAIKHYYMT